ncbi:acetate--CoA ligase family protein [Geodermatophilus sabuli]|uniref:Acetyltransferase n=1 Tax=Geodermatophilus sabuli TaxID=1564158 RepID=A0A285E736_9ACTN|nr:acetate--CoA ligase family protein [Geodermatophilus sabuli]MBB3082189.1 acetyltransferase [Geodermatophilus sabuli]SNX94938.1 acetyltransferase [Geodermatophilus sabuli]
MSGSASARGGHSGLADAVGERRRGGDVRRLDPLFGPRGIAVIGASRDPGKLGAVMARSLSRFPGTVVGVNSRDVDPAAGRFASVADAATASPDPIDLAVLCVPAAVSAQALTEAGEAGVRAALVCSGGYAEAGGPGVGHQRDLVAAARDHGIALLGPNTSGFLVPTRSLTATFVPAAGAVPAGPVAVVAASGGVNHALAFLLGEADIGVSLAVGLGNAVDVTAADVLTHLVDDGTTRAVALHVESVPDGPALAAAVRALTARVPVVALVVGRNDVAEFARSHTGALATSWRTTRAALRAAGAVLVDDERELIDAVTALSALRLPPVADPGVGVVTAQAGPALLHVDGLRGRGVAIPQLTEDARMAVAELLPPLTYQANPVDTGRPGPGFDRLLATVSADPGVDLLSVYALAEPDALDLPAAVESARAAGAGPLVVALGGPPEQVTPQRQALRKLGVPALDGPAALTVAVSALVEDARARGRRSDEAPRPPVLVSVPRRDLDEDEAKALLGELGIPTPPRRACADRAAAHRALAELPGPLAVKLLDATVTHKSDVGGVHLGIRDAAGLDAALDALEGIGATRFLVEPMAPPGVDLIVGASRDPVFGPIVLVGLGGVVAEALADVAVAPAPLGPEAAGALADELSGRALLDGFRGGPVADRTALGSALAALGDLLVSHPEIEDVEINPLRVTADGLLALDAVLTVGEEARP